MALDVHTLCIFLGVAGGAFLGGLLVSYFFSKRYRKQLKKQTYQLNTIEELYNEVQRASHTIDRNVLSTIEAFVQALEAKDAYTRGHSDRVNRYSIVIGKKLGLSTEELDILNHASLLHDIGKIGVYCLGGGISALILSSRRRPLHALLEFYLTTIPTPL